MRIAVLILAILIAGGCTSSLVCRHQVMSHAAWAVERGQTPEIVVYSVSPWLSLGLYNAHAQARTEEGWISEARRAALIDFMFNVGLTTAMKFRKMREAISNGDWNQAATELCCSRWSNQVGDRAPEIISLVKNG